MYKYIFIGALTNKPYAFTSRSWEISSTFSIDILDLLGSNIRIDTYGSQVKRILPLKNDKINREYISNRVRFFFDGLNRWRIMTPILKNKKKFLYCSWDLVFPYIYLKLLKNVKSLKNFGFFFNNFNDLTTILFTKVVSNLNGYYMIKKKNINLADFYMFYLNPNLFTSLKKKKLVFFLGSNLRLESPILNIRLRANLLNKKTSFFIIGSKRWNNLNALSLGLNIKNLLNFFFGKHKYCSLFLKQLLTDKKRVYKNWTNLCSCFIGSLVLKRLDNKNILKSLDFFFSNIRLTSDLLLKKEKFFTLHNQFLFRNLTKFLPKKILLNNINFEIIFSALNNILFNELSVFNDISKVKEKDLNICYYLGYNKIKKYENQLIIFQGHHTYLTNLKKIDILLPTLNFLEKRTSFLNIEGLVQETNIAISNLSNSKSDWIILNTLFIYLSEKILKNYTFLNNINFNFLELDRYKEVYSYFQYYKRFLLKKYSANLFWKKLSKFSLYNYNWNIKLSFNFNMKKFSEIYNSLFFSDISSPYNLDIISKNSKWMKKAELNFKQNYNNFLNF